MSSIFHFNYCHLLCCWCCYIVIIIVFVWNCFKAIYGILYILITKQHFFRSLFTQLIDSFSRQRNCYYGEAFIASNSKVDEHIQQVYKGSKRKEVESFSVLEGMEMTKFTNLIGWNHSFSFFPLRTVELL